MPQDRLLNRQLTRRDLLKILWGGLGVLTTGCVSQDAQTIANQLIQATATAAGRSSPKETPEINQVTLARLKQSTLLIFADIESRSDPVPCTTTMIWKEPNAFYLASVKHLVEGERIRNIRLWRPGVDSTSQMFPSDNLQYAIDPSSDQAIIRVGGSRIDTRYVQYQPLPFLDLYKPAIKQDQLVYGFPAALEEYGYTPSGALPFIANGKAEVISASTIVDVSPPNSKAPPLWRARALVSGGDSGAPVVISYNGQPDKPVMVGLAGGIGVSRPNSPTVYVFYTSLNFKKLLKDSFGVEVPEQYNP